MYVPFFDNFSYWNKICAGFNNCCGENEMVLCVRLHSGRSAAFENWWIQRDWCSNYTWQINHYSKSLKTVWPAIVVHAYLFDRSMYVNCQTTAALQRRSNKRLLFKCSWDYITLRAPASVGVRVWDLCAKHSVEYNYPDLLRSLLQQDKPSNQCF